MKRLGLRLHADEEHWIPLSDLMTGLMFLFLLISLVYMVEIERQQSKPKDVLTTYAQTRAQLYGDLAGEFDADLPKWGAVFDKNTLSIRFYARDVLFAAGSADLKPRFKAILDEFFPRYIRILSEPKYRDIISEVRIEGYTSSLWRPGASVDESYIGNMALSQDRTRSVLSYVLGVPAVQPQKDWLMQVLTANGLSSSHLIRRANGIEDPDASQRVEFRVRTNADEQVRKLLLLSAKPAPLGGALGPPVVVAPMPPYPAWSQMLIGKPLHAIFARTSTRCLGFFDGVITKYAGGRPGAKVYGWGFDITTNTPIDRLVFADDNDTIVGAGNGGFERPDVPARLPQVGSPTTGWQGYVGVTSRPAAAWGILHRTSTVCRFKPSRPSSGEGM